MIDDIVRTTNKLNDGSFDIKYTQDGIYLTVNPPAAKGVRVELNDVLDKLNKKKIRDFDRKMVESTIASASKTPVKIAAYQEEYKLNATVSVHVTADKLKAFVTINPPDGGDIATLQDIIDALKQNNIVYGLDNEAIDSLSKYPIYSEMICVAQGHQPVNGQNGKVEFCFNLNRDYKPTILEDGRVDFRELNLIENVEKGKVLCSLTPPIPGIPGKTVVGTDISALNGKDAILPKGKNVEVSQDGKSLIAAIDGQVSYIDGKINVFANYEVAADVDNSTGNINFIGNVIVRGNVLSGFTIEAGGNVEVWGVVEGATIKASGDIILRRGMQGLGKGILISGGDIIARYIENSTVEAKNIIKAEAIMHSNIKCGNKIELSGKKGLLVGGICKVGKEIYAKVIGSVMNTTTEIELGVDPALKERYRSLKDELATIESDIKKAEQAIAILKKLETVQTLTPEKQEMLAKSVKTKLYYSNKIDDIKQEILLIEQTLKQESNGKVWVQNFIYPGSKISIGTCSMNVKETLQYCTLYRDGADVRVGAYK